MAGISIESLNARAASDVPYEFEFLGPQGEDTGVFLKVLGDHSDAVTAAVNEALNKRRKRDAVAAVKAAKSRPDSVEVTPIEDDIAFGQRLAAVRLVGWRGITETYTPELALTLCQSNPDLSRQVLEAAGDLGNFMKVSPKA